MHAVMLLVLELGLIALLSPLGFSGSSGIVGENGFKATQLFELTTNSTCGGDPPTSFVYNNQTFTCSTGEHHAMLALDGDFNTWWQSNNGDDPVSLTFSGLEVSYTS